MGCWVGIEHIVIYTNHSTIPDYFSDFFKEIEDSNSHFELGSKEDNQFIYDELGKLLEKLQDTVVNSMYFRSLIENAHKQPSLKALIKKEEPLMVYYYSLVTTIERLIANGCSWIPELIVISLLSEWLIDEEKSTNFYPFLNDINYLDLLSRYDNAKIGLDKEKREIMLNMYKISSTLIEKLKNTKYKVSKRKR